MQALMYSVTGKFSKALLRPPARLTASRGYAILVRSTILTIGHSTRPIEEFLDLLTAHEVEQVADVRTSRGNRVFAWGCKGVCAA
jgi:hypothetical protein